MGNKVGYKGYLVELGLHQPQLAHTIDSKSFLKSKTPRQDGCKVYCGASGSPLDAAIMACNKALSDNRGTSIDLPDKAELYYENGELHYILLVLINAST